MAFPQRRGRGKSDGLYDEGFSSDRSKGYTCESKRSLAGAERALRDIEASVEALRRRSDVSSAPILMAGVSRGGVLSVAYAGRHGGQIEGVINFVGGWIAEGCENARVINGSLFREGARFERPMLWIYGHDDYFYSMGHSRQNFDAFRTAGGRGAFQEVTVQGKNNGHSAMSFPPLWSKEVERYLDQMAET